ncbi:hypothetical protein RhiirA4_483780 [Rhizophagus irregularis]|uniref:Uncharacterized protein n=1 Tax=Rhizophagus irregularis TaxID=588596 RepID=A0A2I1HN72_9GLOM|nr:hypothetical protein RhiirA4_483780 [Rhizophagus irregularis]
MAYTTEKLATIFGCTVSDLMAINRKILKSHQTPVHCIKVSPIWRAEAERVLWKRHEKAEEVYNQAANICKKAERAYWRDCADGSINLDKLTGEYTKVNQEKYTRFEEMVVIEQASPMGYPDEDAFGDSDDDSDDSDDEE